MTVHLPQAYLSRYWRLFTYGHSMTGLGCNNKDVSEEGCEISCHSQGLLSGCHMGDMGDMGDICDICDIHDIRDIHDIHT